VDNRKPAERLASKAMILEGATPSEATNFMKNDKTLWNKHEPEFANSKRALEIKDEANCRLIKVLLDKIAYIHK